MNETMKKIAQRRSIWNQIRPSNVTRQIGKLNPQYRAQYERLVAADEAIRKIKGPEGEGLKTLLKELKKNNSGHRWLAVLDRAARINKLVSEIVNNENVLALNEGREENIRDFYFTDQDSKGRSVNMDYINEFATASSKDLELVKQALFGDIPRKITDKFLSSFYDKKEREIRRAMNAIVNRAETLARRTMDAYKELDTARAKGNVGDYLNILNGLRKEQQNFENSYRFTYDAIKEFLPKEQFQESHQKPDVKEEVYVEETKPQEQVEFTNEGFQDEHLGPEGLGADQAQKVPLPQPPPAPKQKSPLPQPPQRDPYEWEAKMQPQYYEQLQNEQQSQQEPDFELPEALPFDNRYSYAAKRAIAMGEYGIAVAILSKYSQKLEDIGDIDGSVKILSIAKEIFNEK